MAPAASFLSMCLPVSQSLFVFPILLLLFVVHHLFLCCYHKQAAYEVEGEVQLATEPQAPVAPTWGDTLLAVAYTAGTTKAKENSKKKDTSWYPTWNYQLSTQWPLSLVQVSMCNWIGYICRIGGMWKWQESPCPMVQGQPVWQPSSLQVSKLLVSPWAISKPKFPELSPAQFVLLCKAGKRSRCFPIAGKSLAQDSSSTTISSVGSTVGVLLTVTQQSYKL